MSDNLRVCETCKWWKHEYTLGNEGECGLAGTSNGKPDHESKAMAVDLESYRAYLSTHADFGCNQWKAGKQ